MQHKRTKSNSQNKIIIIVLLVLVVILSCTTVYFYQKTRKFTSEENKHEIEIEKRKKEKENLVKYLNNIEDTYIDLINEYEEIDSMLIIEKNKVVLLKREVNNLEYLSNYYKEQAIELETRLKEYIAKIKELEEENVELSVENLIMKTEMHSILNEKKALEAKLESGTTLKAYDITATGIKNRLGDREIPTNKARTTDKIKVCFVLSENVLAEPGQKSIYLRIFGPEGIIYVKNRKNTFDFEGKKIHYSTMKTINYDQSAQDICLYWEQNEKFAKGDYSFVLFSDGSIIGSSFFTLD